MMRFPVAVPGMEGQQVELVTSLLTGVTNILVNGTPAQPGKQRGEFFVLLPNGQHSVIQLTPRRVFDSAIRIRVNDVPQVLGKPLTPVETALAWLPILLMFVGGMIGGICAGLGTGAFTQTSNGW